MAKPRAAPRSKRPWYGKKLRAERAGAGAIDSEEVSRIKHCVARVNGRNGTGTAFFIRSDLLLTCTHVVEGLDRVMIRPFDSGQELEATVLPGGLPVSEGDLSLLQVSGGDPQQQAVLLYSPLVEDSREVILAGFPRDDWATPGGYEPSRVIAHGRWMSPSELDMIVLENPADVAPGMSGSPLLDVATGAVIGITRYRKGSDGVPGGGGGAIPVSRAVSRLPQVQAVYDHPPPAALRWFDPTPERLRATGRSPLGPGCLDLRLTGNLDQWLVSVAEDDGASPGEVVNLAPLGGDITSWVFQWAPTRGTTSDLQLVSKILSAALLGRRVDGRYRDWKAVTAELTIRLIVDPVSRLADVPWEYAAAPGARHLGIEPDLALVRVLPHLGTTLPPAGSGRVLALAVQPPTDRDPWLPSSTGNEGWVWPGVAELEQAFREDITPPLQLECRSNPIRSSLQQLRAASCDVLHYQGFIRSLGEAPQVALYNEITRDIVWRDVSELVELARDTQAKLVVVEHARTPGPSGPDTAPRRIAVALLQAGVHAVVTTRHAIRHEQARAFNKSFYAGLAAGKTVERAVQDGRGASYYEDPFDATAFGGFVLWTGEAWGLQILDAPAGPASKPAGPGTLNSIVSLPQPQDSSAISR